MFKKGGTFILDWIKTIDNDQWKAFAGKAERCRMLTLDCVAETAESILKHLTDDQQIQLHQKINTLAPSSMSEAGKRRLAQTVLFELGWYIC